MKKAANRNTCMHEILSCLGWSAFILIVSLVYNHFGHGVHSDYMDFAFLFPLIGVPWYLLLKHFRVHLNDAVQNLTYASLSTLTAGSLLKGIVEIAGTDSIWIRYFFIAGTALLISAAAIAAWIIFQRKHQK